MSSHYDPLYAPPRHEKPLPPMRSSTLICVVIFDLLLVGTIVGLIAWG